MRIGPALRRDGLLLRALSRYADRAASLSGQRAPICRESIFEVSGLASRAPHRATQFLRYVVSYGELAGFDWAFFTATNRLRALLRHLGLAPLALTPADPKRLGDAQVWGSYYDAAPVVCAVHRTAARDFLAGQTRRAAHA